MPVFSQELAKAIKDGDLAAAEQLLRKPNVMATIDAGEVDNFVSW